MSRTPRKTYWSTTADIMWWAAAASRFRGQGMDMQIIPSLHDLAHPRFTLNTQNTASHFLFSTLLVISSTQTAALTARLGNRSAGLWRPLLHTFPFSNSGGKNFYSAGSRPHKPFPISHNAELLIQPDLIPRLCAANHLLCARAVCICLYYTSKTSYCASEGPKFRPVGASLRCAS